MKLCDVMKPEHVVCGLKGNEKFDVINNLIDVIKDDDRIENISQVKKAIIDREKIMSTGVGNSLAIPHAKTKGIKGLLAAFAIPEQPVNFESIDEKPVQLIVLLIGEEKNVGAHIKLLSRVSRMMNNDSFRKSLINAKDCEEVYNLFKEEEEKYEDL